ncbi:MAG: erv26 super protein [Icmadophila ericetorum]|nr:erv26 super protein [Icmadophila ericetorum]
MWILPLIGYIGILLGFAFLTLAIASGLYYLSELVEEHTVIAKKLLTRLIYSVITFQILLVVIDRFPVWLSFLSIGSHVVYLGNLRRFPIVKLSDPLFIISCFLVILNHYLWFLHFSSPPPPTYTAYAYSSSLTPILPSFTEIASYFGLCIWLVPFSLFVSLSAGENVLPSMGSEYATGDVGGVGGLGSPRSPSAMGRQSLGYDGDGGKRRKGTGAKGLVRVAVDGVREWVGETGELMGFWKGERTRRF